jgi:hypothetical protein
MLVVCPARDVNAISTYRDDLPQMDGFAIKLPEVEHGRLLSLIGGEVCCQASTRKGLARKNSPLGTAALP